MTRSTCSGWLFVLAAVGCSTRTQMVQVTTNPTDAIVFLDHEPVRTKDGTQLRSPGSLPVGVDEPHVLTVSRGHCEQDVTLTPAYDSSNIVLHSLYGFGYGAGIILGLALANATSTDHSSHSSGGGPSVGEWVLIGGGIGAAINGVFGSLIGYTTKSDYSISPKNLNADLSCSAPRAGEAAAIDGKLGPTDEAGGATEPVASAREGCAPEAGTTSVRLALDKGAELQIVGRCSSEGTMVIRLREPTDTTSSTCQEAAFVQAGERIPIKGIRVSSESAAGNSTRVLDGLARTAALEAASGGEAEIGVDACGGRWTLSPEAREQLKTFVSQSRQCCSDARAEEQHRALAEEQHRAVAEKHRALAESKVCEEAKEVALRASRASGDVRTALQRIADRKAQECEDRNRALRDETNRSLADTPAK